MRYGTRRSQCEVYEPFCCYRCQNAGCRLRIVTQYPKGHSKHPRALVNTSACMRFVPPPMGGLSGRHACVRAIRFPIRRGKISGQLAARGSGRSGDLPEAKPVLRARNACSDALFSAQVFRHLGTVLLQQTPDADVGRRVFRSMNNTTLSL